MQLVKAPSIPRSIWILGLVSLFTDISSEMIHSVLPLFLIIELGASASMVGLIDGLGEAIASMLKLFSGALSDHLGSRKPLLIAGYGLSAAVKPLFALAWDPSMVLTARCMDRIGKGIRASPRDALVADLTDPENRGAAYGLRQSLDSIGAFIGPTIAFVLLSLSNSDFRRVFWLALIPGVFAVLLLCLGIREPQKKSLNAERRTNPLRLEQLKRLSGGFWLLFAVSLVFTLGNSSDAFILLKVKQMGVPTNFVPLALVVMNIAYALSAYPAGKLSDRIGRKGLLLFSFALYGLVYLGLAFATTFWQIWFLLSLYGLFLGLNQGLLLAITADRLPSDLRGTGFGLINLSIGLGLLPASLLAGWLWDSISPQATFLTGAAFSIAALLLFSLDSAGKEVVAQP
ncbi:MFS transporter [soil metagenome]